MAGVKGTGEAIGIELEPIWGFRRYFRDDNIEAQVLANRLDRLHLH